MDLKISELSERIWRYIAAYQHANHIAPSTREIADEIDISTSTVRYNVELLRSKGYLDCALCKARTITLFVWPMEID